jgi:RES domain-containing protein
MRPTNKMHAVDSDWRPMAALTQEEKREWFPEAFFDQLESWFSADIACCDACHDEFTALWPHAYSANGAAFQRSSIDLNSFYSGSKLQELFTKEEFNEFVKDLRCPRCGGQLGANIWPYELPFDVDPLFEEFIGEIAILAELTPFLILSHKFAQEVLHTIRNVGSSLKPTIIQGNMYRARIIKFPIAEVLAEFDIPPRNLVTEGRYNHAGNPVLYLASDLQTSFEEMRRTPCIVAELNFDTSLKVLDLVSPRDSHPEFADALSALTYSALMSAKQSDTGWHKPAYVFSRFIADCVRHSGIQGIKYPSTRITKDNYNLVIVDPAFRLCMAAKVQRYIRLTSEGYDFEANEKKHMTANTTKQRLNSKILVKI